MNQNLFFTPTDILLPAHADMRRWSVIACDQFTADAGYWQAVQDTVGDAPSTLRLMLPEFYLGKCDEAAATREIQQTMRRYLDDGVFRTVPHSLVLVQRTLPGGTVRCGIVGALDLEAYDYAPDSVTPIRATEGTVASRLPARVRTARRQRWRCRTSWCFTAIRRIRSAGKRRQQPAKRCMILTSCPAAVTFAACALRAQRRMRLPRACARPASARTARTPCALPSRTATTVWRQPVCAGWRRSKRSRPSRRRPILRYALVELVNLHSPAVTFEPIHRVLFGTDASKWMQAAETALASTDGSGYAISLIAGRARRDILAKGASLGEAIAAMDVFCTAYLAENGGSVDYIHGDDEAIALAAGDGCCGILMPRMDKAELFTSVLRSGPFPKKSFSIGLGADKRYYLECRKL